MMNRLTTDKPVKEIGMHELAHNCMFNRDGEAWYRDFDREISLRNMIRAIMKEYTNYDDRMDDDEILDEELFDNLQFTPDSDIDGLIAVFNMLAWSHADLREKLKYYENMDEQGKMLILPCKPGDTVYVIEDECEFNGDCHQSRTCKSCEYRNLYVDKITATLKFIIGNIDRFGKTVFLTEPEAEKALEGMKNE